MIARLRGTVLEITPPHVVLDVSGVGYEVFVPEAVLLSHAPGTDVEFWIRQIFREDGVTLYGFSNRDQRRCFDLLTAVNGCGPKLAMAALSTLGEDGVFRTVLDQDIPGLIKVPGIGAKLAERITRELRDKIQEESYVRKAGVALVGRTPTGPQDDLIDALMQLGYKRNEVEQVAHTVRSESDQLEEQIRLALRQLRK